MNLETQIRIARNRLNSLKFRLRDAEVELHFNPHDPNSIHEVEELIGEIEDLEDEIDELEYSQERASDEADEGFY